ncbi:MAG: AbrB/MazE/SpoVT family DNA-binding domain-containing protein [Actinobacteria bacterium]|nr:AbrB/MazE/SpoVT family DNA-binding domain-containing protein [Actinomycetota bacterium]MBW3647690.1 AbrB/MazE/SpoVT family DNA-binding domain-containing protein [Actinomycetota bacterium]
MRTTIDKAGRLVIPKELREGVGLRGGGEVEISLDGAALRVEPVASDRLVERSGRLVVAAADAPFGDEDVQRLRDADQA